MGKLRPYVTPLLDKLASPFSRISPNIITVLSTPFALAFTYLMWQGKYLDAILFLLLSVFMDALDGAVARKYGRVSKAGALLDSALDRLNDVIIFFSLPALGIPWYITYLWITGSIVVSFIRAIGESEGIKLSGRGLMERGDRIAALLILILIYLFERSFYPLKEIRYVPALAAGVTGLIWLTVFQRLYYTKSYKAFWIGFNATAIVVVLLIYGWWTPLGIIGVSGGLACEYLAARLMSLGIPFPTGKLDAFFDSGVLLSFIFLRGAPTWAFFFARLVYYIRKLKTSQT